MKIYRTLIATALLAFLVFGVIFSYMLRSDEVKVNKIPNKKVILLLSYVYQNPYWQIIKEGAEDAAAARGCVIEYSGPQTPNIDESLRLFDMGISAKVDGIITYVQEDKQYVPYINKAIENKIPVITVDTDAKKSKRVAYIGTNNIEAGRAAGEKLAQLRSYRSRIGIIMAGKTTTSQIERVNGFKSSIKYYSDMKIISVEYSDSDVIKAELVAKKMISENPNLDSLYCTSSVDGIGAARAVIDAHKVGKVDIICFDDLPETLEFIGDGVIQASIVQIPYEMGYEGVNLMMDALEGKKVNSEYLTGIIVVTKEDVNGYSSEYGGEN